MTGHRVFSTLHSNSALGAIPRLSDIGVRADVMAGNIVGIVAQRLVRRLCPHCSEPRPATAPERRRLHIDDDAQACVLRAPVGCAACEHQGYRGRFAIMELVPFDDDMDDLVARGATVRAMRAATEKRGWSSLAADGRRRVLDGSTSFDELARVVDLGRTA